jgi:peptide/nickel transport system permease protein
MSELSEALAISAIPAEVDQAGVGIVRSAARTVRGAVGLAVTVIIVALAVIGPFVAPHSPTEFVTTPFGTPSGDALLGGDALGRDVLSRVLQGGWMLLLMSLISTVIALVFGGGAGIAAAYLRGRTDGAIMRTVDIFLAFPQIIFALLLVSVIGAKAWLIVLAVGVSNGPHVARIFRAAALDASEWEFVHAAELDGSSSLRVIAREIVPNISSPLMVEAGLRFTFSIVVISSLAFLGFGQPPPTANWGIMINENRIGISENPWAVIVPVVLIALITIGMNTFTDAMARAALHIGDDE